MTISRKAILAAAVPLTLAGCVTTPNRIEADVERVGANADRLGRQVGVVTASRQDTQPVVFKDTVYIGSAAIKLEKQEVLPAIFNEEASFNNSVADLREFAERITLRTRIPVAIAPELYMSTTTHSTGVSAQSAPGGTGLPPIPGASTTSATLPAVGAANHSAKMDINFSGGTLKALLDMVAARYGVFWRYKSGEIQFFLNETKTFQVRAVPGTSKLDASVATTSGSSNSSGSSSAGGESSSMQQGNNSISTSVSSELSVWDGLGKSIEAMLSPTGKVVVSVATGTITVTDTPTVIKAVSSFIDQQNESLSKQVMITVQVLSVTKNDSDDYSISWDLVYDNLKSRYGLSNLVNAAPGASSLTLGIIRPSSKWNGSQAVINALTEQGQVHLETTASVVALNNQPAPIQTAKQVTYLAETTTTNTPDVGSSTAIRPGTVSSGFSMQVLPSIMEDGALILQFSADVSALREIRKITSGESSIEAPEVDTKNFLQRIKMRSGETLVLSGFEQTNGNLRYSGVGSARFPLLGGGMNAQRNKESVVVLVTPVIVN
ncbi:type IVB pilus formation outer membrane protein [Thauera sp. 27]|uniref:PilN family type IVB pilus formation outer membrane protein n=1 Tax=Thauera sp. 27 TaxID=305700 RepID=UPI0002CDEA3F|nr:PilN family type IVB pilus formation outer membrane protein [Thauera sp. 27]ENO77592.1 type IVB pilus formation outer membrane protein [Thauera sp. 27]